MESSTQTTTLQQNIHPLRVCLVVLLVLILPLIADAQPLKSAAFQEVRSVSIMVSTHALIYYGSESRVPDGRSQDAYQKNLQRLKDLVESLGHPPSLQIPVAEMDALFPQLESLSAGQDASYPDLLIGLLDADAEIKKAVAKAYVDSGAEASQASLLLRELSERIGDLLMANQARVSRVVGEYSVYEIDDVATTDKRIGELFDALKGKLPEHALLLAEQQRTFRFVRGQLLGNNYSAVSGSAAFYLGRVIAKLDELAVKVAAKPVAG